VDVDAIASQVNGKLMSAFVSRHQTGALLCTRLLRMNEWCLVLLC
jgi:hypothetical protein